MTVRVERRAGGLTRAPRQAVAVASPALVEVERGDRTPNEGIALLRRLVTAQEESVSLQRLLVDGQQRALQELTLVRLALERHAPQSPLQKRDREVFVRLRPPLAAVVGESAFMIRDIRREGAIAAAIGALNARQVGRLLGRCAGHVIDGWMIERVGDEGGSAIWRLVSLVSLVSRGFKAPFPAA